MILVAHFFVGVAVLALIELEVYKHFDWIPCMGFRDCRKGKKD